MKIEVKMTAKDLFDFSMYNLYSGASGVFNLVFTLAALIFFIFTAAGNPAYQNILLIICILLFPVVQPLLLRSQAKKQAEAIGFSTPIHMELTDEKIAVEQAGVEGELEWGQVKKAVQIRQMFIIKAGKYHGYLIPKRSVEGREQELVEILKKNLPDSKTKGLKR